MWVIFRGKRGGVVRVQDLVFVKEGFVVWATLGYHPIIKTFPSLFTAKPKAGFIICYTVVLLYMLCSNIWYSCM
jgi:hypothetical protein